MWGSAVGNSAVKAFRTPQPWQDRQCLSRIIFILAGALTGDGWAACSPRPGKHAPGFLRSGGELLWLLLGGVGVAWAVQEVNRVGDKIQAATF